MIGLDFRRFGSLCMRRLKPFKMSFNLYTKKEGLKSDELCYQSKAKNLSSLVMAKNQRFKKILYL
ncbi:hypothetical protein GCM10022397_45810 [Flavivirga jejuensis]